MRHCSFMLRMLFVLRFVMAHSNEQVELSCRFRVPKASQYAHLLRYLKEHPYKSIHTSLLDAATAFYLPHALIEGSAPSEILQAAGEQSISTLIAQATLITVHLNVCLPREYQLQMPLNFWKTLEVASPDNAIATQIAEEIVPASEMSPLVNPFNFANYSSSQE
jgi:hypothetical protein